MISAMAKLRHTFFLGRNVRFEVIFPESFMQMNYPLGNYHIFEIKQINEEI